MHIRPFPEFSVLLPGNRKAWNAHAGQMLTGISVLTDFGKYLLHDDELIRHKREVLGKLPRTGISFNIQDRTVETEQITQNRIILFINTFQIFGCFRFLFQNTFLDDFIHRGRR